MGLVMMKLWGWVKQAPVWLWVVLLAVGVAIFAIIGWRSASRRLAASIERAKSATRSLSTEKRATDERLRVDDEVDEKAAEIVSDASEDLEAIDTRAKELKAAESENDGSVADLANDYFNNPGS